MPIKRKSAKRKTKRINPCLPCNPSRPGVRMMRRRNPEKTTPYFKGQVLLICINFESEVIIQEYMDDIPNNILISQIESMYGLTFDQIIKIKNDLETESLKRLYY